MWSRGFAAPPVTAHTPNGEGLPLYQAPRTPGVLGALTSQASGGHTLQQQGLHSTWGQVLEGGAVAGTEDAVLVGSIRGSLYALPASGFTAPGEELEVDSDGSLGLDDDLAMPPAVRTSAQVMAWCLCGGGWLSACRARALTGCCPMGG